MSGAQGGRLTKNERREQAREEARTLREEARKREARNKVFLQGGIIVGVVAIVAVIALVIWNGAKPAGPGPRNMLSDGIFIQAGGDVLRTSGLPADGEPVANVPDDDPNVVTIQTYMDFFCPICNDFETANGEYIRGLVDSGAANWEIFPVAILDRYSLGTKYSTRSGAAAACVADSAPDLFLSFMDELFTNQPSEGTSGLSETELIALAANAGADTDVIAECIRGDDFEKWVERATARAVNSPDIAGTNGFGTPTVFVNGVRYTGSISDNATFRNFVETQAGQAYIQSTPTPTESSTPEATETPEA